MSDYPRIEDILYINRRISITEYVRVFLIDLSKREGKRVKINGEFEAERIKGLLNMPKNTMFKSHFDFMGNPGWYEQKVVCVPSNLPRRKTFLFYFICDACHERVKYLYEYNMLRPPLCRKCCRIVYGRDIPKTGYRAKWGISKRHFNELKAVYPERKY